jgi:hypothetical protein
MFYSRIAVYIVLAVHLSAVGLACAADKESEEPTTGKASNILSAVMIAGDHYKVRDAVAADGFMYHFTVDDRTGISVKAKCEPDEQGEVYLKLFFVNNSSSSTGCIRHSL